MEPPNPPPLSLFVKLPVDVVLNILARIPKLYHPTISLVSKSFRSIILSSALYSKRSLLGTQEGYVSVCFQPSTHPCDRRWFSLWIKPDDNDNQSLPYHPTSKVNSTGNWLLPMDSLNCNYQVGSEIYSLISGYNTKFSSHVYIRDQKPGSEWRKAPSMTVKRKNPLTCIAHDKLYVMGGCEPDKPTCWAEVFDPETQTWEPLAQPGAHIRFSPIKILSVTQGDIYVTSKKTNFLCVNNDIKKKKKNFVYLTQENRWETDKETVSGSTCVIDNVRYSYDLDNKCDWYDEKLGDWRLVQGLSELDQHRRIDTEICDYNGKLAMLWVDAAKTCTSEVWCAVILLEKRNNGEVWGQIEWTDHVLTVPADYTLLHCKGTLN